MFGVFFLKKNIEVTNRNQEKQVKVLWAIMEFIYKYLSIIDNYIDTYLLFHMNLSSKRNNRVVVQ